MARTLRRKHYARNKYSSWNTDGSKTNGFYTDYDYVGPGLYLYRPCTKEERFKKFKEAHLDAGTYNGVMSVWSRRQESKVDRQKVRREIHRFMKDIVEDMIIAERKNCPKWYW